MRKASGKCEVSAAFARDTEVREGIGADVSGSTSSFLVRVRVAAGDEIVETAQRSGATVRIGSSLSTLYSKPNWEHFHSGKREGAMKSVRIEKVRIVSYAEHILSTDIIDDGCLHARDHIAGCQWRTVEKLLCIEDSHEYLQIFERVVYELLKCSFCSYQEVWQRY